MVSGSNLFQNLQGFGSERSEHAGFHGLTVGRVVDIIRASAKILRKGLQRLVIGEESLPAVTVSVKSIEQGFVFLC